MYNPKKHKRTSIRLEGHDYRLPGAYFVTVCTKDRICLFGKVANGCMVTNRFGQMVAEEWHRTATLRENVVLDAFVVMPNHVHGIVGITEKVAKSGGSRDMARHVPTDGTRAFSKPLAGVLSTIVGAFKSAVTRRINRIRDTPGETVWQTRFHDHIVRNRRSLNRIRQYIRENPARWAQDRYRR